MVHILSVGKEANLPLLSCQTCCGTCCSCVDSGWSFCLSDWHLLGPPPPGPLWPGLPLRILLHLLQHCCCCPTGNPKVVKLPMSMNLRIFSLHWILAKVLLGPLCKLYYETTQLLKTPSVEMTWNNSCFNWSKFGILSLQSKILRF